MRARRRRKPSACPSLLTMTLFAKQGRFAYATTMPRSEKEKMLASELYRAVGPELAADNLRADRLLRAYNATGADETERRSAILAELLGLVGEGVVVPPPFYCDYGYNIRLGRGVFVSVGCGFLDVVGIEVGDGCQSGPTVQI